MPNLFIGTGGHGHTHPSAQRPFGMVQLGPDTRLEGWDGCSGYHFSDTALYGFSHTHLSGTGVSDYGDLLVLPQSGPLRTEYRPVPFQHASANDYLAEIADPGY
jgi:putative alpha-1,2-mannosidase